LQRKPVRKPPRKSKPLQAFRAFLGDSDMLAYVTGLFAPIGARTGHDE
jgi:hypothetical protein